jgi:fructokinase
MATHDGPEAAQSAGRTPAGSRPLIIGEVLFDVLPDGTRALGGAPFNVAWHLQAFGLSPLVITRVGADALGTQVLRAMEAWGMDTSGVQVDDRRPTGRVRVTLDGTEPSFDIRPDQAYDFLDGPRARAAVAGERFSLLYHGTLIARGDRSRAAVAALKEDEPGRRVFVDVNLRDPWWDVSILRSAVRKATWLKVNAVELGVLAAQCGTGGQGSLIDTATTMRTDFGLDTIIVTRGRRGAVAVDGDGTFESTPPSTARVVDTVGAGDALSAVLILGVARKWPLGLGVERAVEFAAATCTIPGATTSDRRLYTRLRDLGWW